jgi:hypothetical protein
MSDLDGVCMKRRAGTLVPADYHADDIVHGIPENGEVMITLRRARNPKFHRWFFALLRKVIENTDNRWANEEALLFALKIEVEHCEPSVALTGEVILQPKSINFAAMDEIKFKSFVALCLDAIHLNLGIDPDLLMEEVIAEQGEI